MCEADGGPRTQWNAHGWHWVPRGTSHAAG